MNIRLTALLATAAFAVAGAAQAAGSVNVNWSGLITYGQDTTLTPDADVVWDFDSIARTDLGYGFSPSGPGGEYNGTTDCCAAAPPGDSTDYYSVLAGGSATLTSLKALKKVSVYMGSPDNYNSIQFLGSGGFDVTLTGVQLANGVDWGGDRSKGMRMTYVFSDDAVHTVIFRSSQNSYEFDRIAAYTPEPAAWGLMIMGFGGVGAMMRRRRTAIA